nr:MAG TPA: hypothetical protein [Caudoviricetes sp.]
MQYRKKVEENKMNNDYFSIVAEVNRYNRKRALREVYRVARIWGDSHAMHMLTILMQIDVISCSAYRSINAFLIRQSEQGWY